MTGMWGPPVSAISIARHDALLLAREHQANGPNRHEHATLLTCDASRIAHQSDVVHSRRALEVFSSRRTAALCRAEIANRICALTPQPLSRRSHLLLCGSGRLRPVVAPGQLRSVVTCLDMVVPFPYRDVFNGGPQVHLACETSEWPPEAQGRVAQVIVILSSFLRPARVSIGQLQRFLAISSCDYSQP